MCGILGEYVRNHSGLKRNDERFKRSLELLRHRGPNDEGLVGYDSEKTFLTLGHTRLSIIDLSSDGHQPMDSSCGRYSIVFNGEIYNYKELREVLARKGYAFSTDTDTEVLLSCWAEWQEDCISKLNGMFAFVIYDKDTEKLFCARDGFGIKPFFYFQNQNTFTFASEIQSLRCLVDKSVNLDLQTIYNYLVHAAYDDKETTFYKDIKSLKPGHFLEISCEPEVIDIQLKQWWFPEVKENTEISFEQAVKELRSLFLKSVKLHMRSDVRLGAALSGGIDSSAVVCAMRHIEPDLPINTFSYIADDARISEENWVDIVNDYVNAIPHKVQETNFLDAVDNLVSAQGEPFGSTSIYAQYNVFALAKTHEVTVVLEGQGADELLAGYNGYPGFRLWSLSDRWDFFGFFMFAYRWSKWPGRSKLKALALYLKNVIPTHMQVIPRKLFGQEVLPCWIDKSELFENNIDIWDGVRSPQTVKGRRLVSTLRDSVCGGSLSSLLRHADRNSMHWSIESRVPFLTLELAEFLLSLPEEFLISPNGTTKNVFREAMRGIVPDCVLDRKDKIGFATPEQKWLNGFDMAKFKADVNKSLTLIPFLKESEVVEEVEKIIGGQKPFSFQAWRFINLCRWITLQEGALPYKS